MRVFLVAAVASSLAGCVYAFSPKVITHYDEDCEVIFKSMQLTVQQANVLEGGLICSGENECLTAIAAVLLITPVSAIVSSSIVVAGSTAYWLEHKGQCLAKS